MTDRLRIPVKRKPKKIEVVKSFKPSTVLRRIITYCKLKKKPPFVTLEDKQVIGQKVKEKFFNDPHKKNKGAFKIEITEPEGKFRVLVYPDYFIATIDDIIRSHFKQ